MTPLLNPPSNDPDSAFLFLIYSIASRIDIQTLDLYGLLTSMPKTEELEEPDGPVQEEFAMERPDEASPRGQNICACLTGKKLIKIVADLKVDAGDHQSPKHTERARANNAKEGVQTRDVKKSGRKKWQDKLESRQQAQSHDSQIGSPSKATPSDGRSPSGTRINEEGIEFEAQTYDHVKGASGVPSNSAVGKVRKASDLGRPASKRIKLDDP